MLFLMIGFMLSLLFGTPAVFAQTSVPTQLQSMPGLTLTPGGPAIAIDVGDYFDVPGIKGTKFAIFDTVMGRFSVELRDDVAPRHVTNFLTYVQAGDYTNSLIENAPRYPSDKFATILVGGGSRFLNGNNSIVPQRAPVASEYSLPNERGTLAATRSYELMLDGIGPSPPAGEATSAWFFNVSDNSARLGPPRSFGHTVFGRVLGTGMSIVDAISELPIVNLNWLNDPNGMWGSFPVRKPGALLSDADVVTVRSIVAATLFPNGQDRSVVEISFENSAAAVVGAKLSGSTLTLTPLAPGTANITVRVIDVSGSSAEGTFVVTVAGRAPVFVSQPTTRTVAEGSTVVFTAAATNATSYQWEQDDVPVAAATSSTLYIANTSSTNAGRYAAIATGEFGSVRSETALLSVAPLPAPDVGHLTNASVLASVGSGAKSLTVGAVIGGATSADSLPLVLRAVGPGLAVPPFNLLNVLRDPVMMLYATGNNSPIAFNDDWGGSTGLATTFRSVGAFELPSGSLDSAIAHNAPGAKSGGYTLQVTGENDASGAVLVEIYTGLGAPRTRSTPRLINLSAHARVDGTASLVLGFVVAGRSARTMLVRGVGPSLALFGVSELLTDPQLELIDTATGRIVATNDDWAGRNESVKAAAGVGAFALATGTSRDAVLLLTVPPGSYSARVNGVGGTTGISLVEVYEVP